MATTKLSTERRCNRSRLERAATLELAASPADGDPTTGRFRARVLDIGRLGIGIVLTEPLETGSRIRVSVEEGRAGFRRVWCWHGQAVYSRPCPSGYRVGIEFSTPEAGPGEAIDWNRGDRAKRIRLDPPWCDDTSPEPEATALGDLKPPGTRRKVWVLGLLVASTAFAVDQASKAWASPGAATKLSTVEVLPGLRIAPRVTAFEGVGIGRSLIDLGLALGVLLLLGSAARPRSGEAQSEPTPMSLTIGWSLILAGVFGNLFDRIALGQAREILQVASWHLNGADLSAIVGASVLVGLALREHARPPIAAMAA